MDLFWFTRSKTKLDTLAARLMRVIQNHTNLAVH